MKEKSILERIENRKSMNAKNTIALAQPIISLKFASTT